MISPRKRGEGEGGSGGRLEPDPVASRHINAVSDGMAALDSFPRIRLRRAELGFLRRMPADSGGIKQYMRPLHSSEARRFRIPLIPADKLPQCAELRIKSFEAQIAGSEIIFFVIERVVGNMHLAVHSHLPPVRVEHDAGIVINPGGAALKK